MNLLDLRRSAPRIPVDALCSVVANDELSHASMVDLSAQGLRLEHVFDPRTHGKTVQLEIELPGVDEIIWASAVITNAHLWPLAGLTAAGQPRFRCRAGLRLAAICRRERRMLREYVVETVRTRYRHQAFPDRRVDRDV